MDTSFEAKCEKIRQLILLVNEQYGRGIGQGYVVGMLASYVDDQSLDFHIGQRLKTGGEV